MQLAIDFNPTSEQVQQVRALHDCNPQDALQALRLTQGDVSHALMLLRDTRPDTQIYIANAEYHLLLRDFRRLVRKVEGMEAHLRLPHYE